MKYYPSDQQFSEIHGIIASYVEIEEAAIFGSQAIDAHKEASDVAIAIKGKKADWSLAATLRNRFEEATYLPFLFDVVCYDSIQSEELRQHINKKGKVIYRKGRDDWNKIKLDGSYASTLGRSPGPIQDFISESGAEFELSNPDSRAQANEYWTSKQRQGSRIHEISYRACFKPQLPAYFIERLTDQGDIVHDPFMGRGTTPIEAALRGRIPYGNDVNPLSRVLAEPRICPPSLNEIVSRIDDIPWNSFATIQQEELLVFYHPETLAQIEGLRSWLIEREESGRLDKVDQWIRMVAVNRLTGHSPGFFSVYTMPPNQAVGLERQKKINEKLNQTPLLRNVPFLIIKKSKVLLSHGLPKAKNALLLTELAHHTPQIPDKSVSLTVTSPPFLDIVNYVQDNWLRCWFIGTDSKKIPISQFRSISDWQRFIRKTFIELARITKSNGHVAFEVGDVRNGSIRLDEYVIKAVSNLPFEVLGVMVNQQKFTKTSNCWGISNNQKGVNSNKVVLLKRK